jgi:PhzF family phenazine biosynthesis protein
MGSRKLAVLDAVVRHNPGMSEIGGTLLRLSAFATDPAGGNPAGVWLGEALPTDSEMLRIAAEVGYSETAFVVPDGSGTLGRFLVRFFSPLAEVPFCGHATIASGVAIAERGPAGTVTGATDPVELVFLTRSGPVPVSVALGPDGLRRATLTSVEPWVRATEPGLLDRALALLDWPREELDPKLPPAVAFAGSKHLVIAVRSLVTLGRLDYPFEAMKALMLEADLTTVQLVWRETPERFRARDPFAVGNVVEDPATGAAAAAFGAYLRSRGVIHPPARFTIVQGVEMGRPSLLEVDVPAATGGIRVTGTAVPI